MTDVLGICLAVGVFSPLASPTKEAGSSMTGLPAGSLRYELLMFLFAFEVNDAQDTCTTTRCGYGKFGIQEKRRLIARSLQAELPEASPVLQARHVYGLTFILQILMGSNLCSVFPSV